MRCIYSTIDGRKWRCRTGTGERSGDVLALVWAATCITHTTVNPLLQTGAAKDMSAVQLLQSNSSMFLVIVRFLADRTLWFVGRVVGRGSAEVLNLCWRSPAGGSKCSCSGSG
jgi:hypothetical protein